MQAVATWEDGSEVTDKAQSLMGGGKTKDVM